MHELLRFAFKQTPGGNACPFTDELRDVLFVDFFLQHRRVFLDRSKSLLCLLKLALCGGDFRVADLGHFRQFPGAFVALLFGF